MYPEIAIVGSSIMCDRLGWVGPLESLKARLFVFWKAAPHPVSSADVTWPRDFHHAPSVNKSPSLYP